MKNIKIKTRIIFSFIFLLAYKLILDFVYIKFVHEYYNYMGFSLNFNIKKYLVSFMWFFVIFAILPKDINKPSSVFLQLHFIIMIMPMFTTYALANESGIFLALCCIFFIMECLILRFMPSIKIIKIKNSQCILYGIIICITAFVYISMIRANGLPSLEALNLNKVYQVRASTKYPFLMGYLVPWQAKIINPFLITTSYINKNRKTLLDSIFLQLILYLITAQKSFLFIPLAIIIIIKIVEKNDFLKLGSLLAPIGSLGAFLIYKITGNIMIPSLFIRRLLFLPSQIKFYYYDFFSRNEFLYFSEGLIGKVFGLTSPYNIKTSHMIGLIYFNSIEMSANTGYLADAYANMGVFGMFIISILFSMILILIDSLGKNIKNKLIIGLSLFSILSLNDGALLTTLLTGGLLLLLIILYLYSNTKQESNRD